MGVGDGGEEIAGSARARISSHKRQNWERFCRFQDAHLGTSILLSNHNSSSKAFCKVPRCRLGQAACKRRKVSFLTLLSSSAPTLASSVFFSAKTQV